MADYYFLRKKWQICCPRTISTILVKNYQELEKFSNCSDLSKLVSFELELENIFIARAFVIIMKCLRNKGTSVVRCSHLEFSLRFCCVEKAHCALPIANRKSRKR